MDHVVTLLASVCVGLSLSASCGLRAFLPLLVAGLSARLGFTPLSESFTWLQETPALVALGVAVLLEVVGDKVPALDHALDVIQSPVRVIAGGVALMAVLAPCPTWVHVLMGMVGGGAALSVHLTKAVVRVGSSASTAGAANPFVSLVEDGLCLAASVLSVLLTACAAFFALLAVVWVVKVFIKLRARWHDAADGGEVY